MMSIRAFLIASILLVEGTSALAQNDLSLDAAIATALENNYSIILTRKQVEIAENNNSWGQTSIMPSIGLTGAYNLSISDQSENPTSFIQEKLQTEGVQYGAALNWTLFDGFGMFANKRQLELLESQSEGNAMIVVENAVQGVILAYYECLVQQEKLELLEEVITLSRDRLNYMEIKRELGASTAFEILQFDNAIITDSTNYLIQELALMNAMRNLSLLMGNAPDALWNLTTEIHAPGVAYAYHDVWKSVQNENTVLRNQMVNQLIAQQQYKIAQSALFPVLAFNAGVNQSENNFSAGALEGSGRTLNYFGTFTLNFNLFNGGKTRRAIQNARINEEIAQLSLGDLRLNLSHELMNAIELYNAQLAIYRLTASNVENQRSALDIAEERFNNSVINSFDYRAQQVNYLNASIARIEALRNLLVTHTNIVRLRGGLVR